MILKIKAKIYQLFGVYLATKEEHEYLTSDKFWSDFLRIVSGTDMSPKDIQSLLIGSWQAEHGFYRPMSYLSYKYRKLRWLDSTLQAFGIRLIDSKAVKTIKRIKKQKK